eukprot:GFYU01019189.1.p2 GENE.GFYU01019189.1~~GFYU01019189.1.p2  ORF type:complete len:109 (-),score=6.99 GFYU01019189.1:516-842(-)
MPVIPLSYYPCHGGDLLKATMPSRYWYSCIWALGWLLLLQQQQKLDRGYRSLEYHHRRHHHLVYLVVMIHPADDYLHRHREMMMLLLMIVVAFLGMPATMPIYGSHLC